MRGHGDGRKSVGAHCDERGDGRGWFTEADVSQELLRKMSLLLLLMLCMCVCARCL